MNQRKRANLFDLMMIALGTAIYAFGFVYFNMANHLAEGGVAGITLIINRLTGFDPGYATLLLNVPLFIMGAKILGRKSLVLSLYGTVTMSFFIWLWQRVPLVININNDLLIAALLAGVCAGIGSGIVFRYGGTTGGTDIIARITEKLFGFQLGQVLLIMDVMVLTASLFTISMQHVMYTLIASFVYSQIVAIIENGGYTIRGMIIITDRSQEIAQRIMTDINRGVTYLQGEGAYSGTSKKVLYVALTPVDVRDVKIMIEDIDPSAFVSVINVDEVISPDFVFDRKERMALKQ
ncbi:YitT family protein [Streptococcus fryi]